MNLEKFQACQMWAHFEQVVGFRPARRDNSPKGNKQTLTMIVQVGKPDFSVGVLHLGQEMAAIQSSMN